MDVELISIKQNPVALQLTWVINNICTNACSYCPSNLHNGKNHHYDRSHARRLVEILFEKHPKINLHLSGGEPTLSPHLLELAKMFHERDHGVAITTNGVRTVDYYKELSKYTNSICFSYHPSFPEQDLLSKVNSTKDNCDTTVRVMMDPRHWDHVTQFYKDCLMVEGINVEPIRIQNWGTDQSIDQLYTNEQVAWFNSNFLSFKNFNRKNPKLEIGARLEYIDGSKSDDWENINKLLNNKQNDFRGWECQAGLESLFIHYDGNIQRANCRQGNPRIIGHVNQPELIKWPTEPEICNQVECHCPTDIVITKRKI